MHVISVSLSSNAMLMVLFFNELKVLKEHSGSIPRNAWVACEPCYA